MGDDNKEVSLTDVVVDQPTVADQNKFIQQLMQHIEEMRVECNGHMMCFPQVLPQTLLMVDLQSTSLPQIWIQPRFTHLHLLRIHRLQI